MHCVGDVTDLVWSDWLGGCATLCGVVDGRTVLTFGLCLLGGE